VTLDRAQAWVQLFIEPADPRALTPSVVIGSNLAAIIYEIGVVDGVTASVIVPAMRAREKFLR